MWSTPSATASRRTARAALRIAWGSPDMRAGELHGAVAYAIHGHRSAGKREATAKIRGFRHFFLLYLIVVCGRRLILRS